MERKRRGEGQKKYTTDTAAANYAISPPFWNRSRTTHSSSASNVAMGTVVSNATGCTLRGSRHHGQKMYQAVDEFRDVVLLLFCLAVFVLRANQMPTHDVSTPVPPPTTLLYTFHVSPPTGGVDQRLWNKLFIP